MLLMVQDASRGMLMGRLKGGFHNERRGMLLAPFRKANIYEEFEHSSEKAHLGQLIGIA
jgi:hypothetical protein